MKILSAAQIRQWDTYTIQQENIPSHDLMERAAVKCTEWFFTKQFHKAAYAIFCGKGNNGGDGLAIARILASKGLRVTVYILDIGNSSSPDFKINLERLGFLTCEINFVQSESHFPVIDKETLIIDALFGTGLNKPLQGLYSAIVEHINKQPSLKIAIDLPSGLFTERSSRNHTVIKANYTLTFQVYKLSLLIPENAPYIGEVHILDIGLDPEFYNQVETPFQTIERNDIKSLVKPRDRFTHKGNYGHALIIGGSYGKMGAVSLATEACLRAGAGLTTAYLPLCGYEIMQTSLPEAMVLIDDGKNEIQDLKIDISKYDAIGIGPGLGTNEKTIQTLLALLETCQKPLVLDADALNCLSLSPEGINHLPPASILTPHPKEFDRLFGAHNNDFDRVYTAINKAQQYNIIIVLKGHYTCIATPHQKGLFNTTGNAGLAKGGSGDVLTGMITAFLAQGYQPSHAAILGVYLHGQAADLAVQSIAMESLLARDVINAISNSFKNSIP